MSAHSRTPQETVKHFSVPEPNTGCWLWVSVINRGGYGQVRHAQTRTIVRAHRYAYEAFKEPIPPGLEIDHLCRVRSCVNPDHLEAVTKRENILRGVSPIAAEAKRTHCPQGHPYAGENLYMCQGGRYCRACGIERAKRWRAMHAA